MDALRGDTRFEVIVASFVSETDHNRPCSALTALSVSPSAADTIRDSSRGLTLKSVRLAFSVLRTFSAILRAFFFWKE